jgi:hypothetical protein
MIYTLPVLLQSVRGKRSAEPTNRTVGATTRWVLPGGVSMSHVVTDRDSVRTMYCKVRTDPRDV